MSQERFKPDKNDFIIVVIGAAGCGKTNFINKLTGNAEQPKAKNLKPDTRAVIPYPISHKGIRLVLVDAPGFDDAHRPDKEVLRVIADWLIQKYSKGTSLKIAGLIHAHRISDNRVCGFSYENLQMFGQLCGNVPLCRMRLVTTMWDLVKDKAVAARREAQLKRDFWRVLLDEGATTHRFCNTPDSAWEIVEGLLSIEGEGNLPQVELVEQQKGPNETEAGKALYNRLQRPGTEQKTLRELTEEAKLQNDPALAKYSQAEYERIDAQLQKTFEEMKEMKAPCQSDGAG